MILCVGLSPTIQRTMRFDRFALGHVNRSTRTLITASGKAVNVARVLRILGGRAHLVQTVGGDTGRFITEMLDALDIRHTSLFVRDDAPTRTCTTLLIPDATTELVEEVSPVSEEDVAAVRHTLRQMLPHARALCLSGSFPQGVPVNFYAELTSEANALGLTTVIDAQKAPLKEALAARPFLVKPNLEEASVTLGRERSGDDIADALAAIDGLLAAGATWALVSLGRAGSLLGGPEGRWRIASPAVEAVNPIGSGDSLTAGFLHAYVEERKPVPEAVAFGTACAAANALTPTSGVIRPEDLPDLVSQVGLARI